MVHLRTMYSHTLRSVYLLVMLSLQPMVGLAASNLRLIEIGPLLDKCTNLKGDERSACLEQAKLRIDLANAEIAQLKLQEDAKVASIQAFGIGGPIVAAIIAGWIVRRNFIEEQRRDRESKLAEEKLQFQLKAAEIAMNAPDSGQVRIKGRILAKLFPEMLPPDFADGFNPNELRFGPGGPHFKLELLRLLLEYPSEQAAALEYWGRMFPGDKGLRPEDVPQYNWYNELSQAVEFNSATTAKSQENSQQSGAV